MGKSLHFKLFLVIICCSFFHEGLAQTIRLEVDPYAAGAEEIGLTNDCYRQNNNNWYGWICNTPDGGDGDDQEDTECDDCVLGGSEDMDVVAGWEAGGNWTGEHIINDQTCGLKVFGSGWAPGDPFGTYTWYVPMTETIRGFLSGAEDDAGFCSSDWSGSDDGHCYPSPYDAAHGAALVPVLSNPYYTYNGQTGVWQYDGGAGVDLDAYICPYSWTGYFQNSLENCTRSTENGTNDYRTQWRYRWAFGNSSSVLTGMNNPDIDGDDNSTCAGTFDRPILNSSSYTGCYVAVQWQLSTNGGAYVDIAGATGLSYDAPNRGVGTFCYRIRFAYYVNFSGTLAYTYSNVRCDYITNASVINDLCANAIDITGFTLPYTSPVVTNGCATDDVPVSSCDGPYKNIWWKITGGCFLNLTAITCTGGTTFDNEIAVFTGSCGSWTQVTCNDDNGAGCTSNFAGVTWASTPGVVYYISVGSYYSGGPTGNLQIQVYGTGSVAPANDDCINAINIPSLPYTSAVVNNTCATDDYTITNCDGPYKNVWWKITTPSCITTLTAITCTGNTNFDDEITVFEGNSCGSWSEVTCNDDNGAGCTSNYAGVSWASIPGTVYYISVGSYYDIAGTGNLQLNITGAADVTAPALDWLGISDYCWITDDRHVYSIYAQASDPSGIGGSTYGILALVNFQGSNAGNYGGYFAWNTSLALLNASGYTADQCEAIGGGYVGKYAAGYGQNTITLVGGETYSWPGGRIVYFNVRPNNTFPVSTVNAISEYAQDACGRSSGWTNWQLNFSSQTQQLITCPADISVCGSGPTVVNYSYPTATCDPPIVMNAGIASGLNFPLGTTTVTHNTYYPNGAGWTFNYAPGATNQQIALAACQSVYGSCSIGTCGSFTYYYQTGGLSCDCSVPVGSYEFIYNNAGYTQVGQDYGGKPTSVAGNSLFTRVKTQSGCGALSWTLVEPALGQGGASCSFNVNVVPIQTISAFGTTSVCQGGSTTLTSSTTGGTGTCTYQWAQYNGFAIVDIAGATGSTYTTPPLNFVTTYYYIVKRKCTGSGCTEAWSSTSPYTTVTVIPNNTAGSSTPQTRCINTALAPNMTHATTGATGIGVAVGLPAGVTAAFASNTITISGTPSASGTFNYTIPLTGGCGAINATGTITVTPNNTATASTPQTRCINTALSPNLTHTTTGATGIGAAVGLPAGVTAAWAANVITISGTPSASGTFNYTIPLTGGCGTVNATGTITVTPNNTATASTPQTRCINTALSPNMTHTTTGATGIGAAVGLPAGVTAAFASNTITISGTPSASGTFNYTIPLTGGCGTVNATGTITVTPNNTATASTPQTRCINTALSPNMTHTTTGATGIGAAVGLPAGVTAAFASNTITISGTPSASGTFNYTIPLTGGCGTVNATGTITVTPNMTAAAASSTPTLCISTALTNITHATTLATGIGAPVGLPAGVTAAFASNTITISGTPSASGTFNYTIPLTGGCGAINATGTITVTPNNTATASTPQTRCINTALSPNMTHTTTGATGIGAAVGLPAGVTAAFASNTITISGTPSASGTFNYTIPLTGGCGAINATGTITVTPNNTAGAASSTPTLCISTVLTNITHTTTGATGIGAAVGLPAGVTAAFASNTITISGTPSASGTFNYTIPLTGGCGTVNATGTITVTPNMTAAAASSTPTLCISTALTNITHATTLATGIGAPVGLPAGVTAAWSANIITISGTPTASGTFNYTIPLTGGCGAINATGTITVTPNNTATASTPQTRCINTALSPNMTHTTTGATGIGAAVGLPAGVTAAFASNTITISGTPSVSGTFNYTIPLTGGCGAVNATGTITVITNNTAGAASSTPTLCISTALTAITHTTTGATGIGVAVGLPAGITAAFASNTITISGTPSASGTFNYTIPLTGGCGAVNATGTITVTPNNTATASTPQTRCINTALAPNMTHATTGATGIGAAVGLPAGVTAAWAANVITISGTPTASGTFNYTIPLTGGCGTVNATGTITVTPNNTAGAASSTPTLCISTVLTNITHTTTGATGIGAVVGLPAGVTAAFASNTITISGTPTAAGTFNYTIPLTGGCGAVNATGTITVITNNTASVASSAPTLCISTALTAITHTTTGATGIGVAVGLPAGVTAAWAANVITISGTPTAAGTFNYTIPLTGGCGAVNATGTITVTPNKTATASTPQTRCINTALAPNMTHTTTGATGIGAVVGLPAGVTAAWAANVITISGTPTASGTFNYTIPLTGGCGAVNATGTITVTPNNTATASTPQTRCINTALSPNLSHTTTGATGIGAAIGLPAGVTAAWAANVITISGTPTTSGTFNYTIPLTGGCGTINATGTITVTPNKTVTASTPQTLCINTALAPSMTHATTGATGIGAAVGLPLGVSAAWAANVITISGTPTTSGTFNYTIPLTGGCGAINATGTITVQFSGTGTVNDTICSNSMYTLPSGLVVLGPGVYSDTIPGYYCDSVITVTLVTPPSGTFYGLYAATSTDYHQVNPLTGAIINTHAAIANSLGWVNGAFTMHEQAAVLYWLSDDIKLNALNLTSGIQTSIPTAISTLPFFWGMRYYDGHLYTITTSGDNDKKLVRINPATGALDVSFPGIEINGSSSYDILYGSSSVINPITGIYYIPLYGNVMLAFDIIGGTGSIITLSGYGTATNYIGLLEINEHTGEMYALSGFSDVVSITLTGPITASVALIKSLTTGSGFSNPVSAFDSDNGLYIFQAADGCSGLNPLITVDVSSGQEWCSNPAAFAFSQMEYLNCTPSSILRAPENFNVFLYPNPVKDILQIEIDLLANDDIHIQVFDISGAIQTERRMDGQIGINRLSLELSNLSGGIYIVHIRSGRNQFSGKVIKFK